MYPSSRLPPRPIRPVARKSATARVLGLLYVELYTRDGVREKRSRTYCVSIGASDGGHLGEARQDESFLSWSLVSHQCRLPWGVVRCYVPLKIRHECGNQIVAAHLVASRHHRHCIQLSSVITEYSERKLRIASPLSKSR